MWTPLGKSLGNTPLPVMPQVMIPGRVGGILGGPLNRALIPSTMSTISTGSFPQGPDGMYRTSNGLPISAMVPTNFEPLMNLMYPRIVVKRPPNMAGANLGQPPTRQLQQFADDSSDFEYDSTGSDFPPNPTDGGTLLPGIVPAMTAPERPVYAEDFFTDDSAVLSTAVKNGLTALGNGVFRTLTGQTIDTKTPAGKQQFGVVAPPNKWLIPLMLAGAGLVLFLVLKKKRKGKRK